MTVVQCISEIFLPSTFGYKDNNLILIHIEKERKKRKKAPNGGCHPMPLVISYFQFYHITPSSTAKSYLNFDNGRFPNSDGLV